MSVLVVATALGLSLTACGASGKEPVEAAAPASPTEPATPLGSPSPTETPSTGTVSNGKWSTTAICPEDAKLTPFTGDAADTFGADNVMDAYCEIGDFFYTDGIRAAAPKDKWSPDELNFLYGYLHSGVQSDIRPHVKKALREAQLNGEAWSHVNSLTWFNLPVEYSFKDKYTFPAGGSASQIGGGVSQALTSVSESRGEDVLNMEFAVTTNFILDKSGDEWVIPFERKVEVALVRSDGDAGVADRSWVIYSLKSRFKSLEGDAKPLDEYLAETLPKG